MAARFDYKIVKKVAKIGAIGDEVKELNLISYNKRPPKYDLRVWRLEGTDRIMLKGLTLTKDEAETLRDSLIKELGV